MKMRNLISVLCLCLLGGAAAAQNAQAPLIPSKLTLSARAELGEVTITYHITPSNRNANVGLQLFARRDDLPKEQWETLSPLKENGTPLILSLFKGLDNTGSFTVPVKKGDYGDCRIILFHSPNANSLDYKHPLFDNYDSKTRMPLNLKLSVKTAQKRVTSPRMEVENEAETTPNSDGTYTVVIPAVVKVPKGFTINDNGLWAMAKGDVGELFSQVWAGLNVAQPGGDPLDDYNKIPIKFTMKNVKPGIWNVQFGLFTPAFGNPLQWIYPGVDLETGGEEWVKKAPAGSMPPRLRVREGRFETLNRKPYDFYADNPAGTKAVAFVRGGNYGNAITWNIRPKLNTPGYFVLLKTMGCKFIRFNFNPDRFLAQPLYQHAVDQIVQNIWAAGLYPILAPQDLPEGDTREERVEKGFKVVRAMAAKYIGKSAWLELCNEPHAFDTWAQWKPVAVRYAKAIRAIDPEAFVIVPFEGYGKDGRAAAKDPITEVAVDLYDGHAYVAPEEVALHFGPAIKAALPVLIGEYGGDGPYLSKIDSALQKLPPGLMAAGPWAFTIAGEDSIPLVLDGSTAELRMTPAGQVIMDDYAAWDAGKKKGE
jgi:hypothetical protein